tara:strand:- start:3335 stop:4372 length:1038 start_codon:yes stop_codon:yes gene_type:complete
LQSSEKSIAWLISNLRTNNFSELFETELASTRMRAGICISGCQKNGLTVLPPNYRDTKHDPSVVFMVKFVPDSNTGQYLDDSGVRRDLWLKKINELVKKNKKLVLDYTDNHFTKQGIVGDFYRQIKSSVSGLVLPSHKMGENITSEWKGYTKIIPEPVEVSFIEPGIEKPDYKNLTALWFGHVSNLTYLLDYMATQMHLACPKNLIILTNNMPRQAVEEGAKRAPKGLKINLAKWSLSNMRVAAKISHYALIPSDKNDPRKSGVSPGRLLTSLALGLPVISEDLHSYMPFSKFFAKVGTDDAKNLAQNPSSYHGKVREAQSLIRERYTTSAIENEWVEVASNFLK